MPSTYSPDLRIELIANGEKTGTWGTITNDNLGVIIEDAISGVASVNTLTANQALTAQNGAADQARCAVLNLTTSTTANFAVYAPPVTKTYIIKNSSAYVATIYCSTVIGNTTAAGTGVAIPAGKTVQVRSDGTNFVESLDQIVGSFAVGGNLTVSGNIPSPTLTGTPVAPTAAAGTNTTQVATTAFVQVNGTPTGGLMMWPTASPPTNWLLCNGGAVSRTTYATLFAVIGTTFGAGDGSTTFNLPDYRDRMPIGAGTTYSANSTGGSKDAIVVSHTHTASVTDAGHRHYTTYDGLVGTSAAFQSQIGRSTYSSADGGYEGYYARGVSDSTQANASTSSTATTGISVSNSTTGSSGTDANLPPYLGIYFIIKT